MNKKTLVFIIGGLTIFLLGSGLYFYFKKTTSNTPQEAGLFPQASQPIMASAQNANNPQNEASNPPPTSTGATTPRLYELHKVPVAGIGFIESGKGSDHTIRARYIERGLGHIYETLLSSLIESRISNETHSRLNEAFFGNNGKSVVIRYLDQGGEGGSGIKTRILNIGGAVTSFSRGTSTPETNDFLKVEEVFLPDYIPFLATAEDGADKLFYLENGASSAVGSTVTFKGAGVRNVFSSSFTEWLPQFPNQNLVTLTTKPSANIPGYLFFLNTKTKGVTKILSGVNGLTTETSRDGASVLYAETKNGAPELSVYNVTKKESHGLFLQTLPEKCAWSTRVATVAYCAVPDTLPTAQYPDQWYQGTVSFSDSIWKIDTKTSSIEKYYALPGLDVVNPVVSSDDTSLLFINKITGTPWVFRINEDGQPTVTSPLKNPVSKGMVKIK